MSTASKVNLKKLTLALALSGIVLAGAEAEAGNLTAPFELESTAVLPPGVRNPRFKNLFMSLEDKYSADAEGVSPLGQPLNKIVTFQDLIDAQAAVEDKNLLEGSAASLGLSKQDSPGRTTGEVNTAIDVKVPVLAWGLSEKLTLAVAVPIYDVQVSAATGFVRNDNGQAFVNDVCSSDPPKCNEAKMKLDTAVNQKLNRLGYEPIRSQNISGVGDVKVVGKYSLLNENGFSFALKPAVTLPTGTELDPDKALDIPTGDGQTDLGLTLVSGYDFTPWLNLSAFTGYNVQFADRIERRIPEQSNDKLSEDRETLDRDLGDQISVGASATLGNTKKGFSLGAGYTYQYMARGEYNGTKYDAQRYNYLDGFDHPEQYVHSATVMATFATIDWFKEGKFFYPFQAQIAYSKPIAGKNVGTADLLAAELVLFF